MHNTTQKRDDRMFLPALALRLRKPKQRAAIFADRRTKRMKTRSTQNRYALAE